MPSFVVVTGPKTDLWIVRTVALLVLVTGVVLLSSGRRSRVTPEIVLLAMGGSIALAGIDIFYALTGSIRKVYLLDAAVELGLVFAWLGAFFRARKDAKPEARHRFSPTKAL